MLYSAFYPYLLWLLVLFSSSTPSLGSREEEIRLGETLLFTRLGCIIQVIVALIVAVIIALLIFHFTNPPKPAKSPLGGSRVGALAPRAWQMDSYSATRTEPVG